MTFYYRLNASIRNSKGEIVFDSVQSSRFIKHFHYLIGKTFREYNTSLTLLEKTDKETVDLIYQIAKSEILKDYKTLSESTKEEMNDAFNIEEAGLDENGEMQHYVNDDNINSFIKVALEKLKYIPKEEVNTIAIGKHNPVEQQNRMNEEFEELINFKDPSYSEKDLFFIRLFCRDLAYLIIGQSGFDSTTYLGFGKIIPTSFLASFFKEARKSFECSETMEQDIALFFMLFDIECPMFNRLTFYSYKENWRGKYLQF